MATVVLVIAIGAAIAGFIRSDGTNAAAEDDHRDSLDHTGQIGGQSELASLPLADDWLNSPPLTASALRGKVVLIDFWTYTCINWLRTASVCPCLGREIQGQGIGGNRRPCAGVRIREEHRQRPTSRQRDADQLPGRRGQRAQASGEPSTTATGRRCTSSMRGGVFGITTLAKAHTNSRKSSSRTCWLKREPSISTAMPVSVAARGLEAAADWSSLQSGENYVGYERTQNFASPGGLVLNTATHLSTAPREWA